MKLIDADALAKELMHEGLGYQYNRVMCAPTVDAVPVEDHKIIVEKARREAYHSGYKQGRFDEFIEAQYGRGDHDIIPVIRCKDCKWWNADTCMEWYGTPYAPADGYCFRAERNEE